MSMTSTQLRALYLEFFTGKGHAQIPSASLVPANDPTVLFTTAGMHPLVPSLLGEPHPAGKRLTNCQKCVRTGDIDEVGDDTHLTFFEMLGNWSLGDYFKDDAIAWSFEFLTSPKWLGLPLERLGVTCFRGDDGVPEDLVAQRLWQRLGMPPERIQLLGRDDNWWGPAGKTGPCGPDTEMFFWVGSEPAPRGLDVRDGRWVEIWNDVFMGFNKTGDGGYVALERPNVDTGMGLERTLLALSGARSVFEIDTVRPLYEALRVAATSPRERELRVATDHLRAAAFIISDGVVPTNKDRGYVLRRLIRRVLAMARPLGLGDGWLSRALESLEPLRAQWPELDLALVEKTVGGESEKFTRALAQGVRVLEKTPVLDGAVAFDLFQTWGLPFELTRELAESMGKTVDEEGYRAQLDAHREKSRQTSAGSFTGGLADHSEDIVRYHTLTHLLQAALRAELGAHVIQRGSNITHERLRFDFSHPDRLSPEQLASVEGRVNGWLTRGLSVQRETMSEAQARALGAIGAFGERYGEAVSVYSVVDAKTGEVVSREFCGGPHVERVEMPGRFRILREQAISAGVRRIKARLEPS